MLKFEAFTLAVSTFSTAVYATQIAQTPAMRPTMLAQTTNYWDLLKNHCQAAHERIKNAEDIFYDVQGGTEEHVDETFPIETMIRD